MCRGGPTGGVIVEVLDEALHGDVGDAIAKIEVVPVNVAVEDGNAPSSLASMMRRTLGRSTTLHRCGSR